MKLSLAQIAEWLDTKPDCAEPTAVAAGGSIDSRTVRPGDLFFAVRGAHRDGHDYVEQALAAGAAAAVVEAGRPAAAGGATIRVADPAAALRRLASAARRHWGGSVVAVTGSNGKTTTKEITAALLGEAFPVSKTAGNLNNELGLPLSILRIEDGARAAVLEMGMNHSGEIRRLAEIARPDVGIVTNVSAAHVGHFDSIDGVAAAKRELIESLDAGGTAVLNTDDERVAAFRRVHAGRTVSFGIERPADIRADGIVDPGAGGVRFQVDGCRFETALAGRHNVYNILAALAAARSFGIEAPALVEAVRRLHPVGMRGEIRRVGGVTVIDDCYNANPAAMRAMLEVLRNTPARRRIAVLGEMRELGAQSKTLHRGLGKAAGACGIDRLLTVGGDASQIAAAADCPAEFHETPESAGAALAEDLAPGDAVLLKGSRGIALERARNLILAAIDEAEIPPAKGGC